ncbi:MAG: hypothetical protein JNL92_19375 [Opitutaceae bacterium]|nr:hypothetical protein [Opitutaceae bacterium]
MTSGVRQIQMVQGDFAANRLLAEGWVYLQSVVVGGVVGHVLGHSSPANLEDKRTRILNEALPLSRTTVAIDVKPSVKEKWI